MRLGDVLTLEYGKPLPPNLRAPDGTVPVYGANGIKDWTNSAFRIDPTIVVGRKGSAGEIQLAAGPFWPLDVTYFVDFDRDRHDLRFLYYLLDWIDLRKLAKGIKPGINRNEAYDIPVSVPPLEEQRRIVAVLDEAFAAIATATANAEKNLANAREAFSTERERALSRGQAGWREANLRDLCNIKHGFAFKSEYFTAAGDYVLLTPGNFYEAGGYRDRGQKQKYYEGPIPPGFVLEAGSLLLAMTEQAAGLLGSPIIVPSDGQFLHNQRLGLVEPHAGVQWDNSFFFHVFNTRNVRAEIHKTGTGVKVRHTSPEKIGRLQIAFPTTLIEQRRVSERLDLLLDEFCTLVEIQQRKLGKLEDLKRSILSKAFSAKMAPEVRIAA